jgi:hypothetical protein
MTQLKFELTLIILLLKIRRQINLFQLIKLIKKVLFYTIKDKYLL